MFMVLSNLLVCLLKVNFENLKIIEIYKYR